MKLAEKEQMVINRLNELDDGMFQYEYLLMRSVELPVLEDAMKNDDNLIHGCQAMINFIKKKLMEERYDGNE